MSNINYQDLNIIISYTISNSLICQKKMLFYTSDLNNGEWKQIVIHEEKNNNNQQTRMFVDSPDNSLIIPYSRLKLHQYSPFPFIYGM